MFHFYLYKRTLRVIIFALKIFIHMNFCKPQKFAEIINKYMKID